MSLRRPGAILLISCYELGHQPVGIAQPMGFLEQAGYAPAALDIAVEAFDAERVKQARFIGISVPMHTALRLGVRVATLIHDVNPACQICIFGLYGSINAEYLLSGVADFVIGGEYEMPLVNLVNALDQKPVTVRSDHDEEGQRERDLPPLEGVSRRGRIVSPSLTRFPVTAPAPSRTSLPSLTRYVHLEYRGMEQVVGYVEASRGCLHTCLHCPIVPVYEGRFFLMPEHVVLQDIRQQVAAGATHITFGDPDFLNGPGHSLSIVRAMHAEFPHLTFDFTAKIEHLLKRRTMVTELAALGCLFVISAVESFSDVVLARLKKGHTAADVLIALDILRTSGITLRPSLVAFTPWTTLEDYADMLDIVEAHDLIEAIDPVQYAIRLLIPPGSALLIQSEPRQALETCVGPLDQAGFQYHWTHPDPRMDQLHRDISSAVEEAAKADEDPLATFSRLRFMTYRMAGRNAPDGRPSRHSQRIRPPRMSEPWFCCAEPTSEQFVALQPNHHHDIDPAVS
ncbi:MAG TPA: CUAEP/CCAEP-tail radical SAM protein [Nitrospiraceae bacterium]|nr:CUAEP/CCAEP-tail radical SAM protein [Nitrospiraceae bacterium]